MKTKEEVLASAKGILRKYPVDPMLRVKILAICAGIWENGRYHGYEAGYRLGMENVVGLEMDEIRKKYGIDPEERKRKYEELWNS